MNSSGDMRLTLVRSKGGSRTCICSNNDNRCREIMAALHDLTPERSGWVCISTEATKNTPKAIERNLYRELCLAHLGPGTKEKVIARGKTTSYFARIHIHPDVQALGTYSETGAFRFPSVVPLDTAREIEAASNDGNLPEIKFTYGDLAKDGQGYFSVPNFTRAHAEHELRVARLVAGLTPALPPQRPRMRGSSKTPAGTLAKRRFESQIQEITNTNPPNAVELIKTLTTKYEKQVVKTKTRAKLLAKIARAESPAAAATAGASVIGAGSAADTVRSSRRVREKEREQDKPEAVGGSKRRRMDAPSLLAQLGLPQGATIFSPTITDEERLDAAHVLVDNAPERAVESIMAAAETITVLQNKLKSQERRLEAVRVRDRNQEEVVEVVLKENDDKHVYDMGVHGGLCRFNLTNKDWHDAHKNAAKHLFGFNTWDETVQQLLEWFPELRVPVYAHPRNMKSVTDFEKCLVTRMRMRRGAGMTAQLVGMMLNRSESNVGSMFERWLPRLAVHGNCCWDRFTKGKGMNSKESE